MYLTGFRHSSPQRTLLDFIAQNCGHLIIDWSEVAFSGIQDTEGQNPQRCPMLGLQVAPSDRRYHVSYVAAQCQIARSSVRALEDLITFHFYT